MITIETLRKEITDSQEKINSWVSGINQESAKIELCEKLISEIEQPDTEEPINEQASIE